MVFPVETEERVKRRALNVCRDHLRKVTDVARKVSQMVECFAKEDKKSARILYTEIKKSREEADSARRMVSRTCRDWSHSDEPRRFSPLHQPDERNRRLF